MRIPLDTLPTFRIAAQSESFSQAARALHLTDSAVSHQIKRLEESLGVALFERHGRSVKLSPEGRLFLSTVQSTLGTLADSVLVLHQSAGSAGTITITCSSMFGSKWLSRHLRDFIDRHPHVGCKLKLTDNGRVVEEEDTDVGILFGKGPWPDRVTMLLGQVKLAPVCSPKLFSGRPGIPQSVIELTDYPIIHQDDGLEWRQWLEAAGAPGLGAFRKHIYCNDTGFAIDIAYHGGGITLASEELAGSYVREGTLIRPFSTTSEADGGWYVISNPRRYQEPRVQLFYQWMAPYFSAELPSRGS
jgi:LysR family glycine cleavage system transcriptional activator